MKETPILFTPGNVRAILDGTKTQTRRIVKLPADPNHLGTWEPTTVGGPDGGNTKRGGTLPEMLAIWHTRTGATICCPYSVGDRLWVREGLERHGSICRYRRDRKVIAPARCWEWQRDTLSPLHMPKWAARLWLEISEVRVEQLQSITEADAIAEGCTSDIGNADPHVTYLSTAACQYRHLWDSINGYEAWLKNPWVWAITFKRVPI